MLVSGPHSDDSVLLPCSCSVFSIQKEADSRATVIPVYPGEARAFGAKTRTVLSNWDSRSF